MVMSIKQVDFHLMDIGRHYNKIRKNNLFGE